MNTRQQERQTRNAEVSVRQDLEEAKFFRTRFERYTAEVEKERQQLRRLIRNRNKRLRQIILIANRRYGRGWSSLESMRQLEDIRKVASLKRKVK